MSQVEVDTKNEYEKDRMNPMLSKLMVKGNKKFVQNFQKLNKKCIAPTFNIDN